MSLELIEIFSKTLLFVHLGICPRPGIAEHGVIKPKLSTKIHRYVSIWDTCIKKILFWRGWKIHWEKKNEQGGEVTAYRTST